MGLSNLEKLASSLPVIDKAKPHHFIREASLYISGEYGDYLLDYYGDYNNFYPYIHPDLVSWAEKNGGFWEWENPGCVRFSKN